MGNGSSSGKVMEEDPAKYHFASACDRSIPAKKKGQMILFLCKKKATTQKSGEIFEIILYNPAFSKMCYCLAVFETQKEAIEKFSQLAEHISPLVKNIPSIYNAEMLQKIVECFKENPTWTAAHVAAELEIIECFDNQEFMEEMVKHLSQEELTPLHLACKDGKSKTIEKLLQLGSKVTTDICGNTPLHYLVENHPELLETASSYAKAAGDQFNESLDVLNKYSESPIHIAIRLSQQRVLQLLLDKGANSRMLCGHMYAIHLALKNNCRGCVEVLIKHNKECVLDKDEKYQGHPLHWTKTSKAVNMLIENGAELQCRNSSQETPLHIMARRGRLDCVVALISNGADVNAVCQDNRNALHCAIEAGDVDIVKTLLLFGADHEYKNKDGLNAAELADKQPQSMVNSVIKKALETFADIHRGANQHENPKRDILSQAKSKYSEVKHKVKKTMHQKEAANASVLKNKFGKDAVLCMDGGGIRGLVLTELLFALEETTGHQVADLFDWVSGTSTGSYLALALAAGKPIDHCQRAYFRMKQCVFNGGRPFPSEPLENFLIQEFGKDAMMNSIEYPRVIIPAIMADRKPAVLHLFRNYDAPYDERHWLRDTRFTRPRKPEEQELWRAARCSGAAPTYFRAMDRYIDGGLIANNPTLDVLTEIHKYKKHNEIKERKAVEQSTTPRDTVLASDVAMKGTNDNLGIIISLGTGRPPQEPLKGIDLFKPSSIWETTEVFNNARSFGELLVDQVTNSDDHVVERAKSWCEMVGLPYFRLNPCLSLDVELDENEDRILINMLWETRIYLHKNRDLLQRAGRILLGME